MSRTKKRHGAASNQLLQRDEKYSTNSLAFSPRSVRNHYTISPKFPLRQTYVHTRHIQRQRFSILRRERSADPSKREQGRRGVRRTESESKDRSLEANRARNERSKGLGISSDLFAWLRGLSNCPGPGAGLSGWLGWFFDDNKPEAASSRLHREGTEMPLGDLSRENARHECGTLWCVRGTVVRTLGSVGSTLHSHRSCFTFARVCVSALYVHVCVFTNGVRAPTAHPRAT